MNYIKINELEEINSITKDDYIIIETKNGTKKAKTNQFNYDNKINSLTTNVSDLTDNITKLTKNTIDLTNKITDLNKKEITIIIASSDNKLAILSDMYQKATLNANTELSLPTLSEPKDIIIEIIPSANVSLTWKTGTDIKMQNNLETLESDNIYELYLGYDGESWIGGWVVYEPIS